MISATPKSESGSAPDTPGGDVPGPVRRMLVVCPVSSSCVTLVQTALSFARAMQAELVVLAVIDDPFGLRGLSFPRPSLRQDLQDLVEKRTRELRELIGRETDVSIRELLREGRTPGIILDVIAREQIDLLILPAHRESGLEHLLFGRQNRTLLRRMPCSLLFVKSEPPAVPEDRDEEQQEENEAS